MRSSQRVQAYPRADEVVVEMNAFGETDDAFYIVIPNDLAPLEFSGRFVKSDHWLRSLAGPRYRLVLWENLPASQSARRNSRAKGWSTAASMRALSTTPAHDKGPTSGLGKDSSSASSSPNFIRRPLAVIAKDFGPSARSSFLSWTDWRALRPRRG